MIAAVQLVIPTLPNEHVIVIPAAQYIASGGAVELVCTGAGINRSTHLRGSRCNNDPIERVLDDTCAVERYALDGVVVGTVINRCCGEREGRAAVCCQHDLVDTAAGRCRY